MPDHLKGTLNHEFTLNLDLAPTVLSAAGVPVPQHMQGRDIADLYLGDCEKNWKDWRKDFFYEYSQGRAEDAVGHASEDHVPAVFALVRKDYKVSELEPETETAGACSGDVVPRYNSCFGCLIPSFPIRRVVQYLYYPLRKYEQLFHIASDPYEERDVMNVTDLSILLGIKARYAYLKNRSQNGHRV
jgi:arylsulfatase A-like enzyme